MAYHGDSHVWEGECFLFGMRIVVTGQIHQLLGLLKPCGQPYSQPHAGLVITAVRAFHLYPCELWVALEA